MNCIKGSARTERCIASSPRFGRSPGTGLLFGVEVDFGLRGGMGRRVWGLGFGVWGLGFGVRGSGFGVRGSGFACSARHSFNRFPRKTQNAKRKTQNLEL